MGVAIMYEHLLVPVDGSELSERAMTASVGLARKLGARITGFIVEPFAPPPASVGEGYQYRRVARQHDSDVEAHASTVLARFEKLAVAQGVSFASHSTQSADVDQAIVGAAQEHDCDLIVIATHGRGAIGELLWGSHTKSLMSLTKIPLLVLH
jgi:nucleotide-binding universal stress UspA family protein